MKVVSVDAVTSTTRWVPDADGEDVAREMSSLVAINASTGRTIKEPGGPSEAVDGPVAMSARGRTPSVATLDGDSVTSVTQ